MCNLASAEDIKGEIIGVELVDNSSVKLTNSNQLLQTEHPDDIVGMYDTE